MIEHVPVERPFVGYARVPLGPLGVRGRGPGVRWGFGRGVAVCDLRPGVLGALLAPGHALPAPGCRCGIRIAPESPPFLPPSPMGGLQVAVVAGWGRTVVDRWGARCECATVLAVYAGEGRIARPGRRLVAAVGRGSVVSSRVSLEALAAGHGGHQALRDAMARLSEPVALAFDPSRRAARYRFLLEGTRGRIKHSGTLSLPESIDPGEPVAVGEVAIPGDRPVVSFAHVTGEWRAPAERELRRWAELDGWPGLEILPGTRPLAVQTFQERVPAVAGPHYAQRPFHFRPGRPLPSTGMSSRGEPLPPRRRRRGRGNP